MIGEISEKRDEANSILKGITAKTSVSDPDKVDKAAQSIQADPSASVIDRTVSTAILLQRRGNIEEAIEKWRAVANVADGIDNELGARAWFSVGYLYSEESHLQDTIDAYNESIRLKPNFADAFYNRGHAKSKLGWYDEAITDYDEAIRLKPDLAVAFTSRGIVKMELGWHDEAIADYDEAIRLKPDLAIAFYNRAWAKFNSGHVDEARQDFERALELAHTAGDEGTIDNVYRNLEQLFGRENL